MLPSPNGWSVGLRRRNLTDFGHRRFYVIVTRMKLAGYITETQWLTTLASGNFGAPIKAYEKILDKQRAAKQSLTELEEDLPEINLEDFSDFSEDDLSEEDTTEHGNPEHSEALTKEAQD